ncbi:MAG: glycosyltransferase, partial [Coriobacteriia bacterium]|nr:glycosyltransferase [Coriobacteriia bacterium]
MNVLHVTYIDLPGRRFNGYDLLDDLQGRGIHGEQAVLEKRSNDARVVSLYRSPDEERLRQALARVECRHSMDNLLYPWGRALAETEQFKQADVVHYQVIQNRMISTLDMPMLCRLKPSVWTFHDPWPLTGHCVHPVRCEGWLAGCRPCPYLNRLFPLEEDRAGEIWELKRRMFECMDIDIVVASEFMREMVLRSPLTARLEHVHLIPFGIDASRFLPDVEKSKSRETLNIPEDHFVVLFRASSWDLKGLRYIIDALGSSQPGRPTTLLTVDQKGLLGNLPSSYNTVELGWVEDEALYPRVFSACDAFLMPSTGESFGLMALEAMAAGRPVVCFTDTAVASVTHAPECGI